MESYTEKLKEGETIIRICPVTNKVVLAQFLGGAQVLDLHNDSTDEDILAVNNFIKQHS